jgi:hypothetical protein
MSVFDNVDGLRPGRSVFDLSHKKLMTADAGILYPVQHQIAYPGDVWQMSASILCRMQPLVSPVMHQMFVSYYSFFVPFRRLDPDNWNDFITGGPDGDDTYTPPTWTPTDSTVESMWDYFGNPVGVTPAGMLPTAYLKRAYNAIYNWHFRDQNNIDEVTEDSETLQRVAWNKDYFTTLMDDTERGTPPAFTIGGTVSAQWSTAPTTVWNGSTFNPGTKNDGTPATLTESPANLSARNVTVDLTSLNNNTIDTSSLTTFDLETFRLAAAVTLFMERNQRAGVRLPEFIRSHFNVDMGDHTIVEPVMIGATKNPITINEVLQTGETGTTPQGHMAGHGISNRTGRVGSYRVREHGIVMSLLFIRPEAIYEQGVDRQWVFDSRYDFYSPEFAHLSEQEVLRGELYATGTDTENLTVLGYQARWDELRQARNMVCGKMRMNQGFDHYHMSRQFSSAPALNSDLIECNPRKDIFAAPSEPGFILDVGNIIRCTRLMPYKGTPGLGRI